MVKVLHMFGHMYVPITYIHNVHLATSATSTPCQHPVECLKTKVKLALARKRR